MAHWHQIVLMCGICLVMFAVMASDCQPSSPKEPGVYAVFDTSMGTFTAKLYDKEAPITVKNFVGLATGEKEWQDPRTGQTMQHKPFYNGLIFHRVIPNFMIQGGCPLGIGTGGPGYAIPDEFSPALRHDSPGVLSMANAGPNTGGSQFFVTVAATPWLDGHHSVFGKVISGMDVVNAIVKVPRDGNDRPRTPVVMTKVTIQNVTAGR
jgi:peptidyl-prolyl cis-trans isomerase A (cyclophilin A)